MLFCFFFVIVTMWRRYIEVVVVVVARISRVRNLGTGDITRGLRKVWRCTRTVVASVIACRVPERTK